MRNVRLLAFAFALIACAAATLPVFSGGRTEIVGKGILTSDVTEFWYTYSSSTNPPKFQRYRFFLDGGQWHFYHEKREGNHWPLRESDITESTLVELSQEQVEKLFGYLEGGTVQARSNDATSGDSGPWLYLYWKNDRAKYQQFSFASFAKRQSFEAFCEELANR